jgi:hypothetical protein
MTDFNAARSAAVPVDWRFLTRSGAASSATAGSAAAGSVVAVIDVAASGNAVAESIVALADCRCAAGSGAVRGTAGPVMVERLGATTEVAQDGRW